MSFDNYKTSSELPTHTDQFSTEPNAQAPKLNGTNVRDTLVDSKVSELNMGPLGKLIVIDANDVE